MKTHESLKVIFFYSCLHKLFFCFGQGDNLFAQYRKTLPRIDSQPSSIRTAIEFNPTEGPSYDVYCRQVELMRLPWVRCVYWNVKTDIITTGNWSGKEICFNLCVLCFLDEKRIPNRARLEVQLGNFGCSCESSGVFVDELSFQKGQPEQISLACTRSYWWANTQRKRAKSGWRSNTRELISILSALSISLSCARPRDSSCVARPGLRGGWGGN